MDNLIPLIDISHNEWKLPSNDGLSDYIFKFRLLPNEWFRENLKYITYESIKIGKLKLSTLYRYNYSIQTFFQFLNEEGYRVNNFSELDFEAIERYIHFLLNNVKGSSTRTVNIAALKFYIEFGQIFELQGFPNTDLFDGTEYRALQTEDTLKSMLLADNEIEKIDAALEDMANHLKVLHFNEQTLWALITIIRNTGIRLSEALMLKEDCLSKDIMKKNLLEVISEKNETERFIPVNIKVVKAINYLINETESIRAQLGTSKLFYNLTPRKKIYEPMLQVTARNNLKRLFVKKYNITQGNGEYLNIYYHTFRHQVGTELINNGMSPTEVMQYLGHESMHSTRLYAKIRNDRLTAEYKKLGFIGVVKPSISTIKDQEGKNLSTEKKFVIQLPDGACSKPLEKKVANCKQPNACLFCPKFITTPEYLEVHKDHLERLRADKLRYMGEDLFGNEYVLNQTEKTLEDIIGRLESLKGGE